MTDMAYHQEGITGRIGQMGRTPTLHTLKTMRSSIIMARTLDALGPPPTVCNDYIAAVKAAVGNDWGYMGNDSAGDCVEADTAHSLMQRTANSGKIIIPTTQQALAQYSAITGYIIGNNMTDNGTNETTACQYNETTGFLGHKSDATGMIDPASINHIKWCIQLFGACRTGVNLPQSAMEQSNNGKPWTLVKGSPIIGGHDVPYLYYDANYFYCNTWGLITPIAYDWHREYCDEVHSELFFDWIRTQGTAPNNFSLDQLAQDMASIDNG
jgi:hypothetical protein